ncbi:sensor domain-containing diguanylate cyclase [Rhizobium sp. GCM10022189]|uniref:sensor domain-containing diguanylate cyclase n=1 Tax=Rhizobium sp. GCM10022189 TaxID=3252654 RepID=UPI00361A151E
MKFKNIRRAVLAAILLPFVFMIAEGVVLIRSSLTQYRALENDHLFADVLARGGSIAANQILAELVATRTYINNPDETTRAAMLERRSALDMERAHFNASLPAAEALDVGLRSQLSNLRLAYSRIIAARSAVDQGYYGRGGNPVHIYGQAGLKQLGLVESLSLRIHDPVLMRKSSELMSILLSYYGERLIGNLGQRYLDRTDFSAMSHEQLVQGQMMLGNGMDRLRFHSSSPVVRDILAYRAQADEVWADTFTQAMVSGALRPDKAIRDKWIGIQNARLGFLRQKIDSVTTDIHVTGEALSMRSHVHMTIVLALSCGLVLLVALIAALAVRGIRLVARVTEERELLIKELRNAAQTDLLTGLYNRRGFEAAALALLMQAKYGSRWISVVLFDLDHFKKINDMHGHDAGDIVLKRVAGIARETFRSFDLLVRHGGEEFMALLPDSTPEDAAVVAERVRSAIEAAEIELPGGEILRVTASFGCAGRANAASNRNFEDLVKRADLALYAAKASGRNCVVAGPVVPAAGQEERRRMAAGSHESRL